MPENALPIVIVIRLRTLLPLVVINNCRGPRGKEKPTGTLVGVLVGFLLTNVHLNP
jgi:hypothetical protein